LAFEIPEVFLAAVATAADKGVDVFIGDAVVRTSRVGAGIPSRRDPLFAQRATRVFDLGIGTTTNFLDIYAPKRYT
jgi:hypothetical protein